MLFQAQIAFKTELKLSIDNGSCSWLEKRGIRVRKGEELNSAKYETGNNKPAIQSATLIRFHTPKLTQNQQFLLQPQFQPLTCNYDECRADSDRYDNRCRNS